MKLKTLRKKLRPLGLLSEYPESDLRKLDAKERRRFLEELGVVKPIAPRPILKQAALLRWFHEKVRQSGYEDRRTLLRYLASEQGRYKPLSKTQYQKRRDTWEKRKDRRIYQRAECLLCGRRAQVRHHLFQLQYGGWNAPNNIVGLCRPCHAEIHPWLPTPT